ncbi:hypothetical protein CEXT_270091 [Caerostris extrusa]|uniref:Uncharacterized protein n=1 Tax=Caerostris extrusa TaxID=172846 RepID=A0AAV4X9Q3_CAEEX|nr:hypothetical protein CEXT_270091 [Caerostris extrusa]
MQFVNPKSSDSLTHVFIRHSTTCLCEFQEKPVKKGTRLLHFRSAHIVSQPLRIRLVRSAWQQKGRPPVNKSFAMLRAVDFHASNAWGKRR